MKEQVIQIPDTLEVKEIKDGKIILVEKKKKLTYENVVHKLFMGTTVYWIDTFGKIQKGNTISKVCISNPNNANSEKQLEKLLATNMLMNVAKYLNDGWQPDWTNSDEYKFYIYIGNEDDHISINCSFIDEHLNIYFKSEESAQQAIEILGEETIRLALCTDY